MFDVQGDAVGAVFQALLGGLAAQWLVDPNGLPTARQLREAMRTIAAGIA